MDQTSKIAASLREAGYEPHRNDGILSVQVSGATVAVFADDDRPSIVRFECLVGGLGRVAERNLANFMIACLDANRDMAPVSICLDVDTDIAVLLTTSAKAESLCPDRVMETVEAFRRAIPMVSRIFEAALVGGTFDGRRNISGRGDDPGRQPARRAEANSGRRGK
jgi:hypothetical protein